MEEQQYNETRPQAASFFSALRSWGAPALVGLAVAWCFCRFVFGVGSYVSPDKGECFCRVSKLAPAWRMDYASSVVASTPDGLLLLPVVGLPGDTVSLVDAMLCRNHDALAEAHEACATYCLNARTPHATLCRLRNMGQMVDSSSFVLNIRARAELSDVTLFTHAKLAPNMDDERIFPWNVVWLWNAYQWGPLRLPRKGDQIALSYANVALYGPLIARHEGVDVKVDPLTNYTFKHDYFMLLNSNRNIINDSRKYGPIPDCDIVGVAFEFPNSSEE